MTPLNDRKLLNIIRYAPAVFITLFAVVVNVILIQSNRVESEEKIEFIRENLIEQQKQVVREQIQQVSNQIEKQKSLTVKTLEDQLRSRVYEAHNIATNIYQQHRDKPKEDVVRMIREALRPIRFNSGRGYFFIFDREGMNVLHSYIPQLEGQSVWETKDVKGTLIVQEHIDKVNNSGG